MTVDDNGFVMLLEKSVITGYLEIHFIERKMVLSVGFIGSRIEKAVCASWCPSRGEMTNYVSSPGGPLLSSR